MGIKKLVTLFALAALITASVAFPTIANAAAGDLDPSFSGDGIAYGAPRSDTWDVAVDSKGRIVTVGGTDVVTRFLPNGKLDKSFSGNGLAQLPFNVGSIAIDSSDRIVVAGSVPTHIHHQRTFAVGRLKANGKPDPSFSGDGEVVTPIGGPLSDGVGGVAIDQQGRIVAAGSSSNHGTWEFAVARYLPNGEPDDSFSEDGQTRTRLAGDSDVYGTGVALDSKGRIVETGTAGGLVAIAKYTPAGNLDSTFSQDGIVLTNLHPYSYNGATAVAIDDHDRIVVGADNQNGFAVLRYRPNGTFDPTFSGDGVASTGTFGYDVALSYGLGIDDQGRVVVSGLAWKGTGDNERDVFALARLTPQGALDPSFSQHGLVTTSIGREAFGRGLALDSQDRILVAGRTGKGQPVVARYLGG
jgi:uncharacterized delta-60 repeat protein